MEKDLDDLLKLGEEKVEDTACREAPIYNGYNLDSDDNAEPFMGGHQGLMITFIPQGQFMEGHGALRTTRWQRPPCDLPRGTPILREQTSLPY